MQSYAWKVTYQDGSTRQVYARSRQGSLLCASRAAKLVGIKGKAVKATQSVCLYAVGYMADSALPAPEGE